MPERNDKTILIVSPDSTPDLTHAVATATGVATIAGGFADAADAVERHAANLVVVDARDEVDASLAVIEDLAAKVAGGTGTILVAVLPDETDLAGTFFDAGATQVVRARSIDDVVIGVCCALRVQTQLVASGSASLPVGPGQGPTRLPSAAKARGYLRQILEASPGHSAPAILVQIAIGRLGHLNNVYGRTFADAVLTAVAQRFGVLAASWPGGDDDGQLFLAHLAGSEFVVVFAAPHALADALAFSRDVVATFGTPFDIAGGSIYLNCRVGIAIVDPGMAAVPLAIDTAFQQVGDALARAQAEPTNAIEIYSHTPSRELFRRMADLESDLHSALEVDEVDILFQPQIAIGSSAITGVEALVRWRHPIFGELSAQTLLDVAAGAELATRLGTYIQRRALALATAWPRELDRLRLSINVTATDLKSIEFIDNLDEALARTGFPASRLTIELTETELMASLDTAAATLQRLHNRGVQTALDDFGTGYSSLTYLTSLPLNCLKIDKRMVDRMSGGARDRAVMKAVVDMARALGMHVVAEGVETEAQLEAVRAAGCDAYQGFYCAEPMTSTALVKFVAAWAAA